jgi:hypothetical protein
MPIGRSVTTLTRRPPSGSGGLHGVVDVVAHGVGQADEPEARHLEERLEHLVLALLGERLEQGLPCVVR